MNLNKVIAAGYLFKAPSINFNAEGTSAVVRFQFGSTEIWRDRTSGENQEHTERFVAVKFNVSPSQADFIKNNFHKGTNLYVEGRNRTRKWRQEGSSEDRYITEIIINNEFEALQKIGDPKGISKPAPHSAGPAKTLASAPAPQPEQTPPLDFPDDVPSTSQDEIDYFADLRQ